MVENGKGRTMVVWVRKVCDCRELRGVECKRMGSSKAPKGSHRAHTVTLL